MGGIAPFYTVTLKPFGTRPQCPDDAATEELRRNQAGTMTINDKQQRPGRGSWTLKRPAEARRAFREVAGVEAAKLPERCHLDRTRAVCLLGR